MDLTVRDLSILLQRKEREVNDLVRNREIPFHDINDRLVFNKQQIVEWALDHAIPLNISGHEKMAEYQVETITAMLDEKSFYYDCSFTDANYIETMVGMLPPGFSVDREIVIQLLKSREALMSTAIGNGISLPHPRIPLVIGSDKPVVKFFFPSTPLHLPSIDKVPVHTLVLIISQTVKQHLSILAHLSFLLSNPDLHSGLAMRNNAQTLLSTMSRIEQLNRNEGSKSA